MSLGPREDYVVAVLLGGPVPFGYTTRKGNSIYACRRMLCSGDDEGGGH